jgi:hypothetical protein
LHAGQLFQLLARASVWKGVAGGDESLHGIAVVGQVMRLNDGAIIPIHAQPCEQINSQIQDAWLDARSIQVLYSQHDAHALLTRESPRHEKCAGVAEV